MRGPIFVLLSKYYGSDQIKEKKRWAGHVGPHEAAGKYLQFW